MQLGHLLISARQTRHQLAQTLRQVREAGLDTELTLLSKDPGGIL